MKGSSEDGALSSPLPQPDVAVVDTFSWKRNFGSIMTSLLLAKDFLNTS